MPITLVETASVARLVWRTLRACARADLRSIGARVGRTSLPLNQGLEPEACAHFGATVTIHVLW